MNLGDAYTGPESVGPQHWRTVAEVIGARTVEERWLLNGFILTAYTSLVRSVRTNAEHQALAVGREDGTQVHNHGRSAPEDADHRREVDRPSAAKVAARSAIAQTLAELFLYASGKVRRCADCGKWYASTTARQAHCSKTLRGSCTTAAPQRQQSPGAGAAASPGHHDSR